MLLQDFYDYKTQLVTDLLRNENIVPLISDQVTMRDAVEKLLYTQVFPYEYIPETVVSGYTFVCCEVDIQSVTNKTFLIPTLYIWVFAHGSQQRLPNHGGVRTDRLCSEIDRAINGSKYYGLGELNLYSVKRFAPMTDYSGKVMTYQAHEFNRLHDPKSPIPANRKIG